MRQFMHQLLVALGVLSICDTAQGQVAAPPARDLPRELPIEHFTKYDDFGGIKLSPSGEYAAYLTGKYGRSFIAIISLKDKKQTGGIRCQDGFEIYDYDWVSETRIAYRISERQPGMAQPTSTGEMFAIDVDGKRNTIIYGYRAGEQETGTHMATRKASFATPEIISPTFGDEKNILIAEYTWKEGANAWYDNRDTFPIVAQLNVFTGAKNRLGQVPLAGATILVDRNEQARFGFGLNDQSNFAVTWKPDPKGPWTAFELPGFRPESVTPQLISEDNRSVMFTGTRTDESLKSLFSLNLATKEVTKVLGFDNTDVSYLVLDFAGTNVIGAATYTDEPNVQWLDKESRAAKVREALYRAFPKQTVSIESTTKDGRKAVVFVSSDVNPGDYYLFDTETMKADYLHAAMSWVNPDAMRPKEPFAMKARDGVELHGYLTRPVGAGPYPLVVLPHGGPVLRDYWDFDWEVQLLANRGYAVLQVNYRGSSGYGEEFIERGYEQWGASMQDDITDATHWAIDKKIADQNRICIYGASYGGYAALQGAVREPTLYRCAIGYAGIYDLELMLSSADTPDTKRGRAYLQRVLGNDRNHMHAYSPAYNADKIQVPILLIHGKEDWRAAFEQAKRMKAALEKNNKKFEWMSLSREGHGVYDEETRREVYERIVSFLDRNLKSGK